MRIKSALSIARGKWGSNRPARFSTQPGLEFEELIAEVREVAGQVARTGEAKKMHPMNPYERRLVHLTVREFDDAGLWAFRFRRAPDRFHAVSASQVLGGLGVNMR